MLAVAALPCAHAQSAQSAEIRTLESLYVTGSNIPRTDIEGALPVQVIGREEIERSGVMTAAALLNRVSANLIANTDVVFAGGAANRLFPSVNLRGLGDGSTLVLVNGRRLANYAANGGAVNLNFIPMVAIERVEILKDGASAIYGTDAMAGVVNFVLRTDFTGTEGSGYADVTEHGGGNRQRATITAGYGKLATDRFNVYLAADYQNYEALPARDRPFSATAYRPEEGFVSLNRETFPANVNAGHGLLLNPTAAQGCVPPLTLPLPGTLMCGHDSNYVMNILPPVERTNVFGSANFQLTDRHRLFANYLYSHNDQQWIRNQAPSSEAANPSRRLLLYPAGGPFYPTAFAAEHQLTGDLSLFYRAVPLGPITDDVRTDAHHAVVGGNGVVAGWNYDAAGIYSENRQTYVGVSGRVSAQRLITAMASGQINPFGPSGATGDALLANTQVRGEVFHTRAVTRSFEARVSRSLLELPAGAMAVALGAEARHERLEIVYSAEMTSGDVLGSLIALPASGSRSINAAFGELSVPIAKSFDAQFALRYDHYSDFGAAVNPKVALSWRPAPWGLVRASYGTGFRAPTLLDLFTPSMGGVTTRIPRDDPLRCPTTHLASDCRVSFDVRTGGNPDLEPEKSRQLDVGFVWEPSRRFSLALDYWRIDKKQSIGALTDDQVFRFFDQFRDRNVVRGPVDTQFPALPGPIRYVFEGSQNLGELATSGIDVDVALRSVDTPLGRVRLDMNGTYVAQWKQQLDGLTWTSAAGRNVVGAIPRWRHSATLNWTSGPWSATLAQSFSAGYIDANVNASNRERRVGAYETWDVQLDYRGFTNLKIAAGIFNLFDRAPPFSNQTSLGQFMYDPRYADPRGRTFYARLTLAFG